MTSEQDSTGTDTPEDGTNDSLNALLEAAQHQLRDVVEQATSSARKDVETAAVVLEEREKEIAALQATLSAERLRLATGSDNVAQRVAEVTERQKAVDAQALEVESLKERATKVLADALERSARVIEEADARVEENEAQSKAEIERELLAARAQASDVYAQADRRLEAVATESEAMLQNALDRGVKIVSIAEVSAERSKSELRQLVTQIEEYLTREKMQIDLESELQIDLRGATDEDADSADSATDMTGDLDPVDVSPLLAGSELSLEESQRPDAVACEDAMEHYFEPSGPETSVEAESSDRVADAVRRAVRNWSTSRPEAD
jgi:hypothetical protein